MGGRVFASLEAVINRYRSEQIVEGHRLERAVNKSSMEIRWTTKAAEEIRNKGVLKELSELNKKKEQPAMKGFLSKKSKLFSSRLDPRDRSDKSFSLPITIHKPAIEKGFLSLASYVQMLANARIRATYFTLISLSR